MVVSESKVDASYPDSQFHIPGYHLHRQDRKKGGSEVLMLVSSKIESRRIKIDRKYKTIEIIDLILPRQQGISYYSLSTGRQRKLLHTTSYFLKRN